MQPKPTYLESRLSFEGDALAAVASIAESAGYKDYVLYEQDDEWSLGLGVLARVTVYPETTVLSVDGDEQSFVHRDLGMAIEMALSQINLDGWRAYGTADFELSRLLYELPLEDKDRPLIKIFVPQAEVRLAQSAMLLRAIDGQRLEALRNHVQSVLDAGDDGINGRAKEMMSNPPEIDTHDADPYMFKVASAVEEIRRHDYRKVILSRPVPLQCEIDFVASYVAGRRANTPARSYMLNLDGLEAAGFSPETVLEVTGQGEVFTTPLAGTRSIGNDVWEEMRLREELVSDSKEIAEHAISVYLAFDEMTMVCDPTSVVVTSFMLVSRRGSVQHLASRLRGSLLRTANSWYAFNALFPAVTASGVPKKQSIDAIGRWESKPRGLYSGCVMICDQGGELDSALVLRSFYRKDGTTWLQAGAGIMNMSKPERELEETREKLRSCSLQLVAAQE